MTEKKQKDKLAEAMIILTNFVRKTQRNEEIETNRKKDEANKEEGRIRSIEIIKDLPTRIKEAAKKGESSVDESYDNCDSYGGYMFGFISLWAEEQGFRTKLQQDIDPMNEGGNRWNSLTISWGDKNDI